MTKRTHAGVLLAGVAGSLIVNLALLSAVFLPSPPSLASPPAVTVESLAITESVPAETESVPVPKAETKVPCSSSEPSPDELPYVGSDGITVMPTIVVCGTSSKVSMLSHPERHQKG